MNKSFQSVLFILCWDTSVFDIPHYWEQTKLVAPVNWLAEDRVQKEQRIDLIHMWAVFASAFQVSHMCINILYINS